MGSSRHLEDLAQQVSACQSGAFSFGHAGHSACSSSLPRLRFFCVAPIQKSVKISVSQDWCNATRPMTNLTQLSTNFNACSTHKSDVIDAAHYRLRLLSYPQLRRIACEFHEGVLTLRGVVGSYLSETNGRPDRERCNCCRGRCRSVGS
jgi:hypothetical protein